MEQLTKNQAVATSQEAVQNQNEPQLRDENAHNDKSVHGVLNPTYQAGLRLMLVMVVFFIAFRWIHLSTPLIRLFLLVLTLLLMPTLNFLPVWFALSLLRFRLPSRLPMMFILWMVAMMVVIIPSRTV